TELIRDVSGLRLVLAPRHINRVDEIKKIIERHGLTWRSRKEPSAGDPDAPIVILDTMGELHKVYACADVAFVGGALFEGPGGHNPLEPAALGVPVLFGPHMDNCRDAADMLESAGGAWTVSTADELAEAIRRLLTDETLRADTGHRAAQAAREGQGAMSRNIEMLERVIGTEKPIPS
ncbi:MAG: glycosyltransferase, partial [Candidatus Hydrogenedentes bacterium]|nr:glycosyltransferase [Candidatus Hydrogenedentota bacterium]